MIRTLEQKRNQIDDTIAKARLLKFTIGFPASVQKAMRTIDILKFYKEKDLEHAMHDSAKALSEMTEEERIQVETWIEVFSLLMVIAVQEEEYIGLRKVRDCVKTYNEACMGLVLKKSDNGFSEELEGYSEYERNMMAAAFAINEIGKASKAAMENGYDMSASFKDCGEVYIKRTSGKEEKEDESATEENMIGGETDVTV